MVKSEHKKGFSLAEILVAMLILSIFFLAGAKVYTRKQKDEVMKKIHGFYECYWDGGTLKAAFSKTGSHPTPQNSGNQCLFNTIRNNSLFTYTILFPDSKGGYSMQYYINSPTAVVVPPSSENNLTATITDEENGSIKLRLGEGDNMVYLNDALEGEADDYDMVMNKLKLTAKRANIIEEENNQNGAVIISW